MARTKKENKEKKIDTTQKAPHTNMRYHAGLSTKTYLNGNYYYRFQVDGKIYDGSTGCQFKKDADTWLRAYKTKLALEKVGINSNNTSLTFNNVFEEYLRERRNALSEKYVKNIKGSFIINVLPFFGDISIASLSSSIIIETLNKYLDKGRSKSGYNVIVSYIRTILNYARKQKYISSVPDIGLLKTQKKKKPVLNEENILPFLEAIDKMDRPKISVMVRGMLYFGLRENEARLMKWSNFDFKQNVYTPDKTKNYDAPDLPFPSEMLWHLNKLKAVNPEGNDWVILGYVNKPVAEQYARNVIAIACASIGIEGITNHRLRASFITLNARAGTDAFLVMKMARHSSFKTTEIYIETALKDMKKASDNLWNNILVTKEETNIS